MKRRIALLCGLIALFVLIGGVWIDAAGAFVGWPKPRFDAMTRAWAVTWVAAGLVACGFSISDLS